MADWLLIRLPRAPATDASWIVVDARGVAVESPGGGPLSLAQPAAAGRHVCVLVPGTDVLMTEPELPVKAGTKLAQMVPYALEEQLADDIDDLHFAIGRRGSADTTARRAGDSARTPVAVVARALMADPLTLFETSAGRELLGAGDHRHSVLRLVARVDADHDRHAGPQQPFAGHG